MKAERLTGAEAYHAEGPVWAEAWGGLRWVDMLAGDVLSLGSDGGVSRRHVGAVAAALRPRAGGGAVIAVERGFALEAPDGTLTTLPELWQDPGVRMNEGGCDPDGRFHCGTMAYDARAGAGTLFRLDPQGVVEVVLRDVTLSNGLDWSPDGRTAYYVDTATGSVSAFEYDRDRGLTGRRTFAAVPGEDGAPDGLTVDAEGGVWVALYGGGAVRRYAPSGELDAVVELPVTKATACTFGGPGLDRLFITTSREDMPEGAEPQAGSVFTCVPGVRGLPARPYAG